MQVLAFVLVQNFGLACGAALLFFVGVLLALPAARSGSAPLTWLPLFLFRVVLRLLGEEPGLARLCLVIFGFNGTAMLLYMASGFHPVIPAAVCLLTGYNIAAILLLAGEKRELGDLVVSPGARWTPPRWVAGLCGLAVLVVELPCFWYSIAMGIGLGLEIASGQTDYIQGFAPRLDAYLRVLLPALFASAMCESIAIRGMSTPAPTPDP